MKVDNSYLNKTVNKWPRSSLTGADKGALPKFVVWHETVSQGSSPYDTLDYNLKDPPGTSYTHLIARDGTVFPYVDARLYVAYHAGVKSSWLGYQGWEVNVYSLGVELDGPNDGTPITQAQVQAAEELAVLIEQEYGIPLDPKFHPEHTQVAPNYKTDSRGVDMAALISRLAEKVKAKAMSEVPTTAGAKAPVPEDIYQYWAASGGMWQPDKYALGLFIREQGEPGSSNRLYLFERGALRLKGTGGIDALLLPEAVKLLQTG